MLRKKALSTQKSGITPFLSQKCEKYQHKYYKNVNNLLTKKQK